MSALRSILLHLDASPRSAKRLVLAHELAALHGAQVTALYASAPNALSLPLTMAQGAAEMLPMLRQLDAAHRDSAKARFDREVSKAASAPTPTLRWRELRDGLVVRGVAEHALCADLLVLGQHDESDAATVGVPSDFVASVLLASGRPALIVPCVDVDSTLAGEVLIAWKPTREAAHAVSAAIPFLRGSKRIHLVLSAEPGETGAPAGALEEFLRAHDVLAPIEHHPPVAAEAAGEGLLSLAADVGADLLVMGCYGHSRARELVLGGASRTVLRSMTLPVLMAH